MKNLKKTALKTATNVLENEQGVSRRDLIKGGAVLAGAALAGSLAAAQSETQSTDKLLAGKVAFVTGAARGIGRAIAVDYARHGADVALLDIVDSVPITTLTPGYTLATRQDLDETVAAVEAEGVRALPISADVRDLNAMLAAGEQTATELGGIDIAVANAGIAIWTTIEDYISEAHWEDAVDVNINGVVKTVWAVLPHMKTRGAGRIITLSSIGGRQGVVGNGAYAPTKWAVIGFTKSASLEFGKYNITVNAIAPSATNTPMYRSEAQMVSTGMTSPEQQDQAMLGYHALPHPAAEPQDIADAATFLASDRARYVSGITLDVALGGNSRYTA